MRDRDAVLDQAIREAAAILGTALRRLLFPDPASRQLDVTSQQFAQLLRTQPRRTKDRPQRAAIQGPVVRHNDLAEWALTAQDNVASHLADDAEASPLQGSLTGTP